MIYQETNLAIKEQLIFVIMYVFGWSPDFWKLQATGYNFGTAKAYHFNLKFWGEAPENFRKIIINLSLTTFLDIKERLFLVIFWKLPAAIFEQLSLSFQFYSKNLLWQTYNVVNRIQLCFKSNLEQTQNIPEMEIKLFVWFVARKNWC